MQQRLTLQETFDHARFHDAFTGLPNRRYFMDQLDRALRDVRTKRRQRIAVIIVDIARFKLINDMLGHTAGDELMVQAARRFEKSTSAFEGVLARWSGDQFAVLMLDAASAEAALNMAPSATRAICARPSSCAGTASWSLPMSGVTCVDSGQQRAEDVVREADIALSVAKRQETTKIVAYAPNMAGQAASLVSLEADLHVALEKHELRLLFQPIVDLRTYQNGGRRSAAALAPSGRERAGARQIPAHRRRGRADGADHPLDHSQSGQARGGMAAALPGKREVLHQHQSLADGGARSGPERIRRARCCGRPSCRRRCSNSSSPRRRSSATSARRARRSSGCMPWASS